MSEQVTGTTPSGIFSPSDTGEQILSGIILNKPGVRKTSVSQMRVRRRTTMTYLLDELKQQAPAIPDTFAKVDRRLPSPPAPAILRRAIGTCYSHFLEFGEPFKAVQDSRELLLEAICGLADENQSQGCAANMSEFETRLIGSHAAIAVDEINKTYEYLASLLQDTPTDRSLPWQSRLLAVSHFLSHLSKPETLSQGSKIGAQIICLAQRLASCAPSRLAEMIASAGIEGSWATFDGKIVNIDEHSLKPGADEILYRPGENQRSFAAKIIQCLMLNNCLRRRNKAMIYSETPGRPGRDYGGQIVRTIDGEIINPKIGANLTFVELAMLARFQFGQKSCVIVNDASFGAQTPELADSLYKQDLLVHINSESDLSEAFMQANIDGNLPVMLAIDERRLLADSYKDGINHCINVVNNQEFGQLKIFNPQLLPGMQRLTRISLQRLYNATLSVAKA